MEIPVNAGHRKELAAKRGVEYNPTDEQQHEMLASDYVNQLYGKYGSEILTGAAYNWGWVTWIN